MTAEERLRSEIAKCRRCEACRELVDSACLVFPEMFSLADRERDAGRQISTRELVDLAGLCNLCGICPCRDIRSAILNFKTEYLDRRGLELRVRLIESVERIGKLGGTFPGLTNALLQHHATRTAVQGLMGIHRERRFPRFPERSFDKWWHDRKDAYKKEPNAKRKAAYLTGCTARYLFPGVAEATVDVLEHNGIEVEVPEQQCCGMPALLEGDRKLTTTLVRSNVEKWADIVDRGYDIVCSCPTCAYMLKAMVAAGTMERKLQHLLDGSEGEAVAWPVEESPLAYMQPQTKGALPVAKRHIETAIEKNSHFAKIDPGRRFRVSRNTYDVGEYLLKLRKAQALNTTFKTHDVHAVYYPPCHTRELHKQSPYRELLNLIPGFQATTISGSYCCGNAGIRGFKKEFHHNSIRIAGKLISAIRRLSPELIITECLSCRLQFQQLTPYAVMHPVEIIREAYAR